MRIYLSAPYSSGKLRWTERMLALGSALLDRGHAPFVPHLTHFWDYVHPQSYETWLAYDLEWLRQCDLVIRLEGHSPGADREVEEALRCGIPVVKVSLDAVAGDSGEVRSLAQLLGALDDKAELPLDV